MDFFDILHFNDVYHLSEVDRVSKFASILTRQARELATEDRGFTIFSGDCFSPSLEASLTQGEAMMPVLNNLGIDVACPGNHDFDYGVNRLKSLLTRSEFPWTLCNYLEPSTKSGATSVLQSQNLLAGMKSYVVRTKRGVRFGFFGLGGTDWPSLCQNLPRCRVEDPVMAARILARYLRQVQKCDVVIAITHMRLAEDLKVADATAAQDDCHINLLLGGHDHEVVCRVAGDTCSDASRIWQNAANDDIIRKGRVITRSGKVRIVKSGSDFQGFSKIRLLVQRTPKGKVSVIKTTVRQVADLSLTRRYIMSKPHPVVRKHLLDIQSHLSQLIATPLAKIGAPMDGRETLMRSQETNLGNFLCDMLKLYYDTDVAFTNSGSIRSDRILGSHDDMECLEHAKAASSLLRVRDVLDMLPFRDTFEIKLLTGRDLRHILEVSVSENSPEGKFLQISGVSFEVNKKLQPGCRVSNIQLLTPMNQQRGEQDWHQAGLSVAIHSDRLYTAVLPSFLARGYDGYDAIRDLTTVHRKGLDERMTHAELMLRVLGHTITRKGHSFDGDLNTDDSSDRSTVGGSSGTPHLELDPEDKQTFPVCNGNDSLSSDISQVETGALARARRGLVKEYCKTTNLPVVFSTLPGRVRFLNCTSDY